MATIKSWGGLGLAPGVTVTTATVGTGDTAFNAVTGTPPVTANFGFRWPSMKFDQLAAASSYVAWTFTGDTTMAARWYGLWTAMASASATLCQGLNVGAQQFRVDVAGTAGVPAQVRIRNAANAEVANSGAAVIPLGSFVVVEVIDNAGALTVNVYLVGSGTPILSVSATVGALAIDQLRIGNVLSAVTLPTFYLDDLIVTDTAAPIPQVGAPTDLNDIRPLQYNCNRVAGTLVNGVPSLDAQGAANRWAFTSDLDLVHALNVKAGNVFPNYKELQGVCNQLAGTSGLGVDGASSRWASG